MARTSATIALIFSWVLCLAVATPVQNISSLTSSDSSSTANITTGRTNDVQFDLQIGEFPTWDQYLDKLDLLLLQSRMNHDATVNLDKTGKVTSYVTRWNINTGSIVGTLTIPSHQLHYLQPDDLDDMFTAMQHFAEKYPHMKIPGLECDIRLRDTDILIGTIAWYRESSRRPSVSAPTNATVVSARADDMKVSARSNATSLSASLNGTANDLDESHFVQRVTELPTLTTFMDRIDLVVLRKRMEKEMLKNCDAQGLVQPFNFELKKRTTKLVAVFSIPAGVSRQIRPKDMSQFFFAFQAYALDYSSGNIPGMDCDIKVRGSDTVIASILWYKEPLSLIEGSNSTTSVSRSTNMTGGNPEQYEFQTAVKAIDTTNLMDDFELDTQPIMMLDDMYERAINADGYVKPFKSEWIWGERCLVGEFEIPQGQISAIQPNDMESFFGTMKQFGYKYRDKQVPGLECTVTFSQNQTVAATIRWSLAIFPHDHSGTTSLQLTKGIGNTTAPATS